MIAGVPIGQLLGTGGGWMAFLGLVWYVTRLVLKGKLVPGGDRDAWRATADKWQGSAHELGMAVEKLTGGVDAANHALTEIQTALRERPQ